jgi:hypothetical protein
MPEWLAPFRPPYEPDAPKYDRPSGSGPAFVPSPSPRPARPDWEAEEIERRRQLADQLEETDDDWRSCRIRKS